MKLRHRDVLLAAAIIATVSAQLEYTPEDGASDASTAVTDALSSGDPQAEVSEIVRLGAVDCAYLDSAEDAATLTIAISSAENITADKASYSTMDGSHFDDGITRKAWTGTVSIPAQGDDETAPRSVSMVWGDPCDSQTFSLKMTSFKTDGSTVVVKSIPCDFAPDTDSCLVQVTTAAFLDDGTPEQSEPIPSSTTPSPATTTSSPGGRRSLRTSGTRALQTESVDVDVMYLFNEAAMTQMGGVSPAQMNSIIFAGLLSTNDAFKNSLISLTFNLAFIGFYPGDDDSGAISALDNMRANDDVTTLRNTYQADLVQLVGAFTDFCSIGYSYTALPSSGFSVVGASCIDGLYQSDVFGLNMGCFTNTEDASIFQTEYAHGYRVCEGDFPFSTLRSQRCPDLRSAPRINHYSNPDVLYAEQPTGTATADCARTIRENMDTIASYQPVVDEMTPAPTPSPTFDLSPTAPPPTDPPTPTMPPTTNGGYVALGCWGDSSRDRVLTGSEHKNTPDMTAEVCAALCEGSTYFGTEFGRECFCGTSSDDPARLGESGACTVPCVGDSEEICGGRNAINVYRFADYTVDGCYIDSTRDRVLTAADFRDDAMTTDICAELCAGYPLFGTEFGKECYCGSASDEPDELGPSDGCTFQCPGAPVEKCGGRNAISVYRQSESEGTLPPTPAPTVVSTTETHCSFWGCPDGEIPTGGFCYPEESGYTPVCSDATCCGPENVNACLDSSHEDYRCNFDGSGTTLDLSGCNLVDTDGPLFQPCFETFGKDNINVLWMSFNDLLTTLPVGVFDGLTALTNLDLAYNGLATLPDGLFSGVDQLTSVSLHFNNDLLTFPEGIFADTPRMENLELSSGGLESLREDTFAGLTELNYLDLALNALTELPAGLFDGLSKLQELHLGLNSLTSLPPGLFSDLVALEELKLWDNQFTTLPEGLFEPLGSLTYLNIVNNPDLQCLPTTSASEVYLGESATSTQSDPFGVRDGTCECTPEEAVLCETGLTCEPGKAGYTCV